MLANPDPHYASPPITRAPLLLGLSFALLSVALLFVAARIIVKWKLKQLGKEDVFIVMSAVCPDPFQLSCLIRTIVLTSRPGDDVSALADHPHQYVPTLTAFLRTHPRSDQVRLRHAHQRSPPRMDPDLPQGLPLLLLYLPTNTSQFYFAMGILGGTPSAFNKLSMLTFYLRLSPHPTFRTMCHLCIAYTALTYTAISIVNVFGCIPISGAWSSNPDLHAKCISKAGFYYFIAINNIALDMVMLILPIPILLKLRVSVRVKIGLVAMFTMGFLYALPIPAHGSANLWG